LEGFRTVIVVTASVKKKDEKGAEGNTPASLLLITHIVFTRVIFLTSCFVLSARDGKIEQCVCIKFCMKLGKSATESLDMLHEALEERSLRPAAIFLFAFQGRSSVS
jgi:hypothetical protein